MPKMINPYQLAVRPRSEVEELVTNFIIENKISAYYGKDMEGVFVVHYIVEEETDDGV